MLLFLLLGIVTVWENDLGADPSFAPIIINTPLQVDSDVIMSGFNKKKMISYLKDYCIQEQLIEKDNKHTFSKVKLVSSDLDMIRQRNIELKGAPRLEEFEGFFDPVLCAENLRFNASIQNLLEVKIICEPDRIDYYQEILDQNKRLSLMWSLLYNMNTRNNSIFDRRLYALNYIKTVGIENYQNREIPPYVTDWLFREIK